MRSLIFAPEAEADLAALLRYITKDSPTAALSFVESIRIYCDTLRDFPILGFDRGDIRKGLRAVAFDRRATVVFEVKEDRVIVIGILYRGRDVQTLIEGFRRDDP